VTFSEIINSRLTTREVAVRYGLEPNRKGFVCCPFHHEKTASMKIYPDSRGFYCFGCGAGGDTIGLVGKMFDVDYQQALRKLDEDFDLCLYKKPTLTQRRKFNEQLKTDKQQRELLKKHREYSDFAYILLLRYRRWLNRQEQTESVRFDISYVDRLLDRYSHYENLIDFDIWARLNALHSKHRR
jgi:DNA primase